MSEHPVITRIHANPPTSIGRTASTPEAARDLRADDVLRDAHVSVVAALGSLMLGLRDDAPARRRS